MKALSAISCRSGSITKLVVLEIASDANCFTSQFPVAAAKETGWVEHSLLDVLFLEVDRASPGALAATPVLGKPPFKKDTSPARLRLTVYYCFYTGKAVPAVCLFTWVVVYYYLLTPEAKNLIVDDLPMAVDGV